MRIGIYAKSLRDNKHEKPFIEVLQLLAEKGHEIFSTSALIDFAHMHFSQTLNIKQFDFCSKDNVPFDVLICVGGDGTILDAVSLLRDSNIPVLGLNTGRLGFLAATGAQEIAKSINEIEKGNYKIDSRTLIQIESNASLFDYNVGLNDFVIHKKETSSMIVVHTFLNGEFLNSYWADGLIVSTPTGSTGYSLSCGGPIIFPKSDNFVITPIAPHNLNVRPVVVNDDHIISFEIEGRANSYLASLDARSKSIEKNVQMAVRKANHEFQLIKLEGDQYMDTLRNKLFWGYDKRN